MRTWRTVHLIAGFLFLSLVGISCAPAPTEEPTPIEIPPGSTSAAPAATVETEPEPTIAKEEFTLVIAVPSDISTLDFHQEPSTQLVQHFQMFEDLVWYDDDLVLQPRLATSWELINDTTLEFKLREGVKFHNGEEFTAEDVQWSIDRMIALGVDSGPRKNYVDWFEEVEIVDDFTIRIHTKEPFPGTMGGIAIQPTILPKDYFEQVGAEEFAKNPIGTGPYKFVEWSVNEFLEFEAFDDYWGGRPAVDRVIFRVIPDEATRVAEMLAGTADIIFGVPPARIEELQNSGITVDSIPSTVNFWLGLNTNESPFDDVLVRRAAAAAIDVDAIIGAILGGNGTRANSLLQNTTFGWDPSIKPFEYDPDEASRLLEEAGFPNGFQTTLSAGPVGLFPQTKEVAEAIAAQLGEVGIQTEINIMEFGTFFEQYREGTLEGLHLFGNSGRTFDPVTVIDLNFGCPPDYRGLYFCSEETDALMAKARNELDVQLREAYYLESQEALRDAVAAIPLWQYNVIVATSERVNWEPRRDAGIQVFTVAPVGP